MSRLWAAKYEKIHFSSMHPGMTKTKKIQHYFFSMLRLLFLGWADTPGRFDIMFYMYGVVLVCMLLGVETAMPSFHSKFSSRLRSTEQVGHQLVHMALTPPNRELIL